MENNNNPFSTPQNNNTGATELLSDTAATQEASTAAADASTAAPQTAQPVQTAAPQQPYNPYQAAQPVQTAAPQQPYNPYQAAQPVQTAAPQQPYNPYQVAQPVQTATPQQPYNPYQTAYQSSVAATGKRSVGKIVSLVIGIILTVLGAFWLLAMIMVFISDFSTYGEVEISIPVVIIFSLPLIIGIILTVFGAKKKKVDAVPSATTNYYAAPQPTPAATVPTQAAVPTATVPTTAVPTATAPTTAATTNFSAAQPNTTVADSATQAAAPTVQPNAAPSMPTFNQAGENTAQNTVSTAQTYQYAPTVTIQDDSKELTKKNARKNGLIAIGIIVLMWVILFLTDRIFWYLLIIPIVMAVNALRNNIKSIAGWASLVLSILSVILFILLLMSL